MRIGIDANGIVTSLDQLIEHKIPIFVSSSGPAPFKPGEVPHRYGQRLSNVGQPCSLRSLRLLLSVERRRSDTGGYGSEERSTMHAYFLSRGHTSLDSLSSGVHGPVDRIAFAEGAVKRLEADVLLLPGGAKGKRFVGRLDPGCRIARCGAKRGNGDAGVGHIGAFLPLYHFGRQSICTQVAREHERSIENRLGGRLVRHGFDVEPHGHLHFDAITIVPGALESEIAAAGRNGIHHLAVDLYRCRIAGPLRNAQMESKFDGTLRVQAEQRG